MDELLEILRDIDPDVDYETQTDLIDGNVLDSFSIVSLIAAICDEFDIEISPKYLIPENFNSAEAMWKLIRQIQEDE